MPGRFRFRRLIRKNGKNWRPNTDPTHRWCTIRCRWGTPRCLLFGGRPKSQCFYPVTIAGQAHICCPPIRLR